MEVKDYVDLVISFSALGKTNQYIHAKLLGVFTFGAAAMSTQHGSGIHNGFAQPTLGILTKINGEIWGKYNNFCNQNKKA